MTKKKDIENIEDQQQEEQQEKGGAKHKRRDKKSAGKKTAGDKEKKSSHGKGADKSDGTQPVVDERYLRLHADFENFRKRVLREKDELYSRANEDIMQELLPVLDHLEMALAAAEGREDDPVVEGFRLVGEQLSGVLKKFGLSAIDTDGCEFDPNLHEAILHMPSEEVSENHIVSDARRGYMLGNRLLRASQVVVSSGAPDDAGEDSSSDTDG
jgi:molecular chaperone GrpE